MERDIETKRTGYNSTQILERRERILREARLMIAEVGHDNFSIRELARRAGVAQKTLYNAFDSKDGIVSSAIVQFAHELVATAGTDEANPSLAGTLQRMVHINTRLLNIRAYMVALISIHNSPSVSADLRLTVRVLARTPNLRFGALLHERKMLAPHITPEIFAERLASFVFAGQTDWSAGYVSDSGMIPWVCEGYLMGFCGLTIGEAKDEGQKWLETVRANDPAWSSMLRGGGQARSGAAKLKTDAAAVR
jgi:TetR/AcrR family transcriptional regulator, cholesterol catabolism regulator